MMLWTRLNNNQNIVVNIGNTQYPYKLNLQFEEIKFFILKMILELKSYCEVFVYLNTRFHSTGSDDSLPMHTWKM